MGLTAGIAAAGVAVSAGSAIMNATSAKNAGNALSAASDQAADHTMEMYQQQRADLAPYREMGGVAGTRLRSLLGLGDQVTRPGTPQVQGTIQPQQAQAAPSSAASPAPAWWPQDSGFSGVNGYTDFYSTPLQDGSGNLAIFKRGTTEDGNTYVGSAPAGTDPAAWLTGQGMTPNAPVGQPQQQAGQQATPPETYTEPGLAAYGLPGLTYHPTGAQQAILDKSTFAPTQAELEATPGYQWNLAQGLKSVESSNAAKGLGVSGAALKGAARFATGLADNTLQTQAGIFGQNYDRNMNAISGDANRFQNNLGNVLNPLMTLYSSGQSSAAQTGALGSQAITAGNNALIGAANARAAGDVGSAKALGSGFTNAANGASNSYYLNKLLDRNSGGGDSGGGNNVGGEGGIWDQPIA